MSSSGMGTSGYTIEIKHGQTDAVLNAANATAQTPVKVVVKYPWSSVSTGLRPLQLIDSGKQVTGTSVMSKE